MKRKTQGRLPQLNKALRLRKRALGQWAPQPAQVKETVETRYELALAEWEGK